MECAKCKKPNPPQKCSRCKTVAYCNVDCQRQHWTLGHKSVCTPATVVNNAGDMKVTDEEKKCQEILSRHPIQRAGSRWNGNVVSAVSKPWPYNIFALTGCRGCWDKIDLKDTTMP